MEIQTPYGICKNVDIEHLEVYNDETNCYRFSDYIINNGENSYLLFGFEV